jgi:hypothetical protein
MIAYTYYDPSQDSWILYVSDYKISYVPSTDHLDIKQLEEEFHRLVPTGWIVPSWYAHPHKVT